MFRLLLFFFLEVELRSPPPLASLSQRLMFFLSPFLGIENPNEASSRIGASFFLSLCPFHVLARYKFCLFLTSYGFSCPPPPSPSYSSSSPLTHTTEHFSSFYSVLFFNRSLLPPQRDWISSHESTIARSPSSINEFW